MNRVAQLALHRIFYAQTANVIEQLQPDIVVSTHPFPSTVVSRLKRSGLDVPLCTVITDYDAHGTWISSGTNLYLVSTSNVRDKLTEKGVPRNKIAVTGIPVHPCFWQRNDKAQVAKELNLKNMPTVLIMGGGWGIMGKLDMTEYLMNWREDVQFIICVGNNDKAREELLENPVYHHPNIQVKGFTDNIDKLMDVADLLITKPGGMTCTEAMAKGLPMLFYDAIPGQEEENLQYFISRGFAETIDSINVVEKWLNLLVSDYSGYKKIRQSIDMNIHAYRPERCVETILQYMDESFETSRSWINA